MLQYIFNDNNNKYIGLLHLIFALFISLYGFIFKKNSFDYIYILYICLVIVSWTFYNGECPLTYYIKKQQNNKYIAGKDSTDLTDMYLLFGSKKIVDGFIFVSIFLNAVSEYIVLKRNNYSFFIQTGFPLAHILYTMSLRIYSGNLYNNAAFLTIQDSFKALFILFLILILCK